MDFSFHTTDNIIVKQMTHRRRSTWFGNHDETVNHHDLEQKAETTPRQGKHFI